MATTSLLLRLPSAARIFFTAKAKTPQAISLLGSKWTSMARPISSSRYVQGFDGSHMLQATNLCVPVIKEKKARIVKNYGTPQCLFDEHPSINGPSTFSSKPPSNQVIGIDLGITNSHVSVMEGENPSIIEKFTPSAVFISGLHVHVGTIAKKAAKNNPANTFFWIKRIIGRKFNDPEVQELINAAPFKIIEGRNGDAWLEADAQKYSPSEIYAFFLADLREIAESTLDKSISRAVIAVPTYFSDAQRQATAEAGRIFGLEIVGFIDEPVAAALSYGLNSNEKKEGFIAVFDLGAQNFDVSILKASKNGVIEVKATNEDRFLGAMTLIVL